MDFSDPVFTAYFFADVNTPQRRPESKVKAGPRILMWEDATQEERDKYIWIEDKRLMGSKTYCFVPPTAAEVEDKYLDRQYHMRLMLNYILENYGIDMYNKVVKEYKERFEEYDVNVDKAFPHCKYAAGQCDLFCKYYNCGSQEDLVCL